MSTQAPDCIGCTRTVRLAAGEVDRALEGRAGLDLDPGRTCDGIDLLMERALEVRFDRVLGLGAVDHGFPAAGEQRGGEKERREGARSSQPGHLRSIPGAAWRISVRREGTWG